MSLALLLAAQAAVAPNTSPYPTAAVLKAFGQACANVAVLEATKADLIAQQWTAETLPEDSPLGQLIAAGRAQAAVILSEPGDKMSDTSVFTKMIAGERLDIILSSVESDGTFVNGCRLYDVGEERRIDLDAAQKWVGRDADEVIDRKELSTAYWSPGYGADHDSFVIYHVPANSPVIAMVKFNGIGLKADFVGETK